jgi:tRNA A37 threonylcarbamoyladenosine biosynthesis protein TsaE
MMMSHQSSGNVSVTTTVAQYVGEYDMSHMDVYRLACSSALARPGLCGYPSSLVTPSALR